MTAPLLVVNLLAGAVWVGSLAALSVVARTARQTLEPQMQVTFFRALGRRYSLVGNGALVLAIATGAALLADQRWTASLTVLVVLTAALVAITGLGMRQHAALTACASEARRASGSRRAGRACCARPSPC